MAFKLMGKIANWHGKFSFRCKFFSTLDAKFKWDWKWECKICLILYTGKHWSQCPDIDIQVLWSAWNLGSSVYNFDV